MIRVLGGATLDIILKTKRFKIGSKLDIDEVFFSLGGGALNAATTFKNLNLDYQAYFRLSKDLVGKIIFQKIRKEKIKTKIFYHSGHSPFSIVVLLPKQERTIFVYRGISDHFSLKELFEIKPSDFYYLTTLNTQPDIFYKFLLRIKSKARLISLNPSKKFLADKKGFKCLKLVDFLIINQEEAETFLNKKSNPLDMGKEIFEKLKIKILVLTLGQRGSLTFFNNKVFEAGVFKPRKVIDSTGAGDAFTSAFFANLVLNKDFNEDIIKKSIIWGSANASANLEKMGAQIGLLRKKDYKRYKNLRIKIYDLK